MPQHKSALKRVRQSTRRAIRNKAQVSRIKTLVKKVRTSKVKADGQKALTAAVKYLDQSAAKGIIHKNKASNLKSSLTKLVNKLS